MWTLIFVGLIGAAIILARIARHFFPDGYRFVNSIAWGIEALFWAIAVAAVTYQYATGRIF